MQGLDTQEVGIFGVVDPNTDNEGGKMSIREWKYIEPLQSDDSIYEFEKIINYTFPNEFKKVVRSYNGGIPDKRKIKLSSGHEVVFKRLLSFNKNDRENVFSVFNWVSSHIKKGLVPFGIDPAGNYFCFDYNNTNKGSIVFWDHEINKHSFVSNTFTQFLDMMY